MKTIFGDCDRRVRRANLADAIYAAAMIFGGAVVGHLAGLYLLNVILGGV